MHGAAFTRCRFQLNTFHIRSNLRSVLSLAVGENLLFIFLFSFLWYSLPPFFGLRSFNPWNCLAFCAAIIASDSSVSISFFRHRNCSSRLMAHMEADTILSEIIAILLFRSLIELQIADFGLASLFHGFLRTLTVLALTAGIGLLSSIASSLLFRCLPRSPAFQSREILIFVAVPIVAYMCAEGFHCSGSIAVRLCGVLMSRYSRFNLGPTTRRLLDSVTAILGSLADFGAFLCVGMLTFFFFPLSVDWRWLALIAGITGVARYASIATVFYDFWQEKQRNEFWKMSRQTYLMYFMFHGSVALTLVMRMEGELLDTRDVGIMLRLVLFMIWMGVIEIILVAHPLIQSKGYQLVRHESYLEWMNSEKDGVEKDALFPYLVRRESSCGL